MRNNMIKLEIVNLSGRYMKQVIYIDVLICVNLVINYFLILATSKFLYLRLKRLRLILGEVLGAFYSLYILLPDYPVFVSLITRLFMAATIMGTVFGFKNLKILAKSVAYFFVVSFLFSGIMFGMWYVFRPRGMAINNGVVYFNISPLLLIASSLVAYTVIEVTNRILEKKENKSRGILILYALPDTCKMGLTEAEAYAVVWETFMQIQKAAPRAIVYYGQETGIKKQKEFDEIGVLLPIREFEKKMLHHLQEVDGIVLACREKMMEKAGQESLDLND